MENKTLRKLQMIQLNMLKDVVKILDDNGLDYFLTRGTLLGAVRHKGFIPWDDDLDIAMPRADYEKFVEICGRELGGKYYLHCNKTDPEYWLSYAKIRKNGTIYNEKSIADIEAHKGIFIDIFPLDNAKSQTNIKQHFQGKVLKLIYKIIILKRGIVIKNSNVLLQKTVLFLSAPISIKALSNIRQRIMAWNKNQESKYFIDFNVPKSYVIRTILKSKYYPIKQIEFEGERFNGMNDNSYYLERTLGDYMKLPAEDKRTNHNIVTLDFGDGHI